MANSRVDLNLQSSIQDAKLKEISRECLVSKYSSIANLNKQNVEQAEEQEGSVSVTMSQERIAAVADKLNKYFDWPFVIYSMDEGVVPPPPFFLKPSPSLLASYYAFYSCEGHMHDLLEKFVSQNKNLSPRTKHAATLFLMNAVHLAKNLKLDVHRTAIWLSIAWHGFLVGSSYRTRSHIHLDRYFEETLIRHCVESSPLGCEVFLEEEARAFQKFFCRFNRLLPLLQLYLFKVFDLQLNIKESRPYLRGNKCSSNLNLNYNDVMEDATLRMDMYNRPKRDKTTEENFKCSKDYFWKMWTEEITL